jgi:peptide/nickel transport system permease protein
MDNGFYGKGQRNHPLQLKSPGMNIRMSISCMVLLAFAIMAIFPGAVAPHDPNAVDLDNRLVKPGMEHPFGTDHHGRDILSRVIYGAQTSLATALSVVAIGVVLGTFIGLLAGFFGGIVDQTIMRIVDLFLAFPGTILSIALVGLIGASLFSIVLALSVMWWVSYARIIRGSVLQVKEKDFVKGSRLMGGNSYYIIRRHVLPNVLSPIFALATLDVGSAILHITGLSFLGLGAQPPTPEWGSMIQGSIAFMETAPQTMIFPGLCIIIIVLSFNCLGDWLKERIDPMRMEKNDFQ